MERIRQWLLRQVKIKDGSPEKKTWRTLFMLTGAGVLLLITHAIFLAPPPMQTASPLSSVPTAIRGGGATDKAVFSQSPQAPSTDPTPETQFSSIERAYEKDIRRMVEQIVGVGIADVLVTVETTAQVHTDRNTSRTQQTTQERGKDGATRHIAQSSRTEQTVVQPQAGGGQMPVVQQLVRPQIRGVLIVAEGVEHKAVQKLVHDALARGLGIPAHRIAIIPAKRSE